MKFDMSAAWNEAMRLLSANRQLVLVVAGVFFFLPYAIFSLVTGEQMAAIEAGAGTDPDTAMAAFGELYGSVWWLVILMAVAQAIGMLGLLALLKHRSRPTLGEALKIGGKSLPTYLVAQILVTLLMGLVVLLPFALAAASVAAAVIVGFIAVVAAVYLFTKFSLVAPVIVVERVRSPIAAMRRSWRLTKGSSFRLWLFYFLLVVAVVVVGIVISMILGIVFALAGPGAALIGNALITALLNAAWATVFLAALAAAHRQLAGESPEAVSDTFE